MIRLRRASRRQADFARLFVQYRGQGARAALEAGYNEIGGLASAASSGTRLLQNDRVLSLVAAHVRDLAPDDQANLLRALARDCRRSRLVVRKLELLLADPGAAPRPVADDDRTLLLVDQRQLDMLGAVARFASAAGAGATTRISTASVRNAGTTDAAGEIDPFS